MTFDATHGETRYYDPHPGWIKRRNAQLPEEKLCKRCEQLTTDFTPLALYCRPCMRDYHFGRYGPKSRIACRPVHLATVTDDHEIAPLCNPETSLGINDEWTHIETSITCKACLAEIPTVEAPKQEKRTLQQVPRVPVDPFEAALFGARS